MLFYETSYSYEFRTKPDLDEAQQEQEPEPELKSNSQYLRIRTNTKKRPLRLFSTEQKIRIRPCQYQTHLSTVNSCLLNNSVWNIKLNQQKFL